MRWYDISDETVKVLNALKNLDESSQNKIAAEIVEVAKQIKDYQREVPEPPLSIGIERVLGLYQSSQKRRWYDKNEDLSNAIKTISTLPEEDFLNIMQGLLQSFEY